MRLKFRITSPADYASSINFRSTIENHLLEWEFTVLDWIESEKTEKQDNKPIFDEQVIQIECTSDRFFTDLYAEMDILATYWCNVKTECWLTFSTIECFHQTKLACHENVNLKMFYYGTFYCYTQYIFHRYVKGLLLANFYHDIQILEIRHRKTIYDNNSNTLTIKYASIRRILMDMGRNSAFLFLDTKYPPAAHSRGRRVLTFDAVDKEVHGKSTVLMLHIQDIEVAKQIISRFHSCNNGMPIHYGSIHITAKKFLHTPPFELDNFNCTYNLYAILTRSFTLLEQTRGSWNIFISQVEQQCKENPACLAKSLEFVLELQERGVLCNYPIAIRQMYQWFCNHQIYVNDNDYTTPPNTKLIRRLVLSPTRTLFYPPEFQFSNRMLRNFNADYALRVSFRDDDNRKLSVSAAYCEEAILDFAVKIPMTNGIKIGERHYKFLAWSNSQIRDHGVWMYAEDNEGNNTDTIRTWMGDFSITKSVSKYMARLGQCFSHTEDTIKVPLDDRYIITEDDIEGGENPITGKPYCFSDGIGKMSRHLAETVSEKLGLKKVPSSFQIRYAGYKGMLVIDPTMNDLGLQIVFRKSMKKFDSQSTQLEIVKKSQAIPVQLNRPMINIINQLGVPNEVFLEIQEEMLSTITDILTDDEKAAEFLTSKIAPKTISGFKEMVNAGIGLTGDPFFRGLLLCLRERAIHDIKVKARLAINPNEGRNMFGVLDETGTLEYGQVFIQYTKDIAGQETSIETLIHTGQVLVTKNPCTQPGDIRILESVDLPVLHHIVDCIVFPQKGNRPHPNEMAGSDLDGDEYAVIWKKNLFFSHNWEPENFPSPAEDKQSIGRFNIHRSVEMLKEYITNDQIGTIGTAHLAISDKYGIDIPICKEIARKFSLALDYVKTGYLEPLTCEEKPHKYPDFMERGTERETYSSERALGELYRNCKIFEQKTTSVEHEYVELKIDPDLIYPGWENFEESARLSRRKYNYFLQSLMQKYGVQTENEAISGAFRKLHERHSHRHDASDAEKLVVRSVETLHKRFRREFCREFGISEDTDDDDIDLDKLDDVLKKASAWYIITYNSSSTRFLSFPWIVAKYLIKLKTKQAIGKTFYTSIITILDDHLQSVANKFPKMATEDKLDLSNYLISPDIVISAYRLIGQWMNRKKEFKPENEIWLLQYFPCILQNSCNVRCSNGGDVESKIKKSNVVNLCLDFLKSIRNNYFLPKNLNWLSSYARDTYNVLAATGNTSVFCHLKELEDSDELVELKPIKVLAKILPGPKKNKIEVLRNILCSLVDLKSVTVRSTEKNCLVVSAVGSWKAIEYLQDFFHVDTETLKKKLERERKKFNR